jgi:pimeloyl-ACP methyl ester carboxylesterase/acyl carrier protein
VNASQETIFGELSELLRSVAACPPPSEDISRETSLQDDLDLDSIDLARLASLIQSRYGSEANTVSLFTERAEGISSLQVGDLVDFLVGLPGQEGTPQGGSRPMLGTAELLAALITDATGRTPTPGQSFNDDGFTSFDMLVVISVLEQRFGPMSRTLLFDHPTVAQLADHLESSYGAQVATGKLHASPELISLSPGRSSATPSGTSRPVPSQAAAGHWPIIIRKSDLSALPEVADRLTGIDASGAKADTLIGPQAAPWIFISCHGRAYRSFVRRHDSIFSWVYAGTDGDFNELTAQWLDYARSNGLRANFLSSRPLREVGAIPLLATPVGAVQEIEDLRTFDLSGSPMRRLRYLISRFERSGRCSTVEYTAGSDESVDAAIAEIARRWSAQKAVVGPRAAALRDDVLRGAAGRYHRVYLTRLDDQLVNVIILTETPAKPGYVLDMELYPETAPAGGLEYGIVSVINQLRDEGHTSFSFGPTFGVKISESPNPAPGLEQELAELRAAGISGPGGFQFKNKFRPSNRPLYLCQPADGGLSSLADLLLAIARPDDDRVLHGMLPPARPSTETAALGARPAEAGNGSLRRATGRRGRNENAAVLTEHAPGTMRRLLPMPGGQVEVFSAGDGPVLIMMHPLDLGAGLFARQFAQLAGEYQLVCVHHPGVGETTWAADLTPGGLARLCRTALADLSIAPPFHVMGCSLGGLVAGEFVLQYPAQCASLTLVGASYQLRGGSGARLLPEIVRDELDRVYASGGGSAEGPRAELEGLLLRCESMEPRVGLGYLNAWTNRPTLLARLPDIAVPTLVLRGRHDSMVPEKDAHVLYGAIPDAQYAVLDDAGHFPCLTHSAEVHSVLRPFLAGAASPLAASNGLPATPVQRTTAPLHSPTRRPISAGSVDRCVVISTGRCGSTLLSDLFSEDPDTLSVYESLGALRDCPAFLSGGEMTGAEYWSILATPAPLAATMARIGAFPEELRYPASGRWASDPRSVPPILYTTLPRMTADPDGLFDTLAERVPQFPSQSAALHQIMLLDLLATLSGRRRWVERSGGSSAVAAAWLGPVLAAYAETKVIYLTRDIADTARSMSQHPSFQLAAIQQQFQSACGADPYGRWCSEILNPGQLSTELQRLLPDRLTAQELWDQGRDIGRFEALCVTMMTAAEQALAGLRPRHLHRIRYEDLVAFPAKELTRLGGFLAFPDPAGWAAATAQLVKPLASAPARHQPL